MNLRIYCRCCLLSRLFRGLVFVSCVLYFLYFTQLLVYTQHWQRQQLLMTSSLNKVKIDRSRCCVRPSSPMVKDICGRENCTQDCPDPVRLPIDTGRENAFFLETSGSGMLNIRQACAVESLAYHNRNLNVNVLFMMKDEQIEKIHNRSQGMETIEKLQEKYKNIQMLLVSLDEFVAGTALEKWYHCTNWRKGPYHVSHLSDGLRFLTLNKFGGYYFDLDVLIVKSVSMYRNFIARESNYDLASNSIHADSGNPVIEMAIKNFVSNYR
jgi:lactosylceramide 4-alpha-galactosyltransferase